MNHLSIYNFGPVKKADLELKSINFLIGEQSIGKSTMAKLIAIFTDNASLSIITTSGLKSWNMRLKMYDLDIYISDTYRIKYDYQDSHYSLSISITKSRVNTSLFVDGKKIDRKEVGVEITRMRRMFHEGAFYTDLAEEIKALNNNEDKRYQVLSLQSVIESSLYVPAERIAFSLNDNLKNAFSLLGDAVSYTFRRFMISLDRARNKQKKYDSRILGITYLNEESGQYFIDSVSKKKYHLYNASSGIQSAIPLFLVLNDIKNREYSSIVIEEPETNLFPNTQVDVLKLILQRARVDGRIVTITTHSPYLLSAMNNFLYAGFVTDRIKNRSAKTRLDEIIPNDLRLRLDDCAVYSIGESINRNGEYCKSILDEDMGMIDANTLDKVSFSLSEQFDKLQDLYLSNN